MQFPVTMLKMSSKTPFLSLRRLALPLTVLSFGLIVLWRLLGTRRKLLERDVQDLIQELLARAGEQIFVHKSQRIAPVRNQFYGHGAFMGAAPALFADAHWRRILAFLMPDVFQDLKAGIDAGAKACRLIPMLENNPVMCAFGLWSSVKCRARLGGDHLPGAHDLSGIEWDVFLDPKLLRLWRKAPPALRPSLIARIVDTMLIAHASALDTAQEHLGLDQYHDVRRTPKTAMGGVEARAWMDLFSRALELIAAAEGGKLDAAIAGMRAEARLSAREACLQHTFARPRPFAEAIGGYCRLSGKPHFSVLIEIKSLASTPALLHDLIRELNRRGVHVAAVASFLLAEIRGAGRHDQLVAGQILPGPREILFFHFAGDLQQACDAGELPSGQDVLFNGGSLLRLSPESGSPYAVDAEVIAELTLYKLRHDLHIGLYVQESDCDAIAAGLLSELVDARADLFDLGFAWGGLQDEAATELESGIRGDMRGYGSQRLLEKLGRARLWQTGKSQDRF